MLNFKNCKWILYGAIYSLLPIEPSIAQNPTPSSSFAGSAAAARQPQHSVSQYSGGLNVAVPLTTISGQYTSLPITLSYGAGNGIKLSQGSGTTGLGWNLMAGGTISRQVNGLPDDCKNLVDGTGRIGASNVGYLYGDNASKLETLAGKTLSTITQEERLYVFNLVSVKFL
jgi:hypothetical protein